MIDLMTLSPAAVIGFTAPKGTGKDTTAERLCTRHNDKCGPWTNERIYGALVLDKVANPLYHMISVLTGLTVEQLQDERTKEVVWTVETAPTPSLAGWSPRKLLEHFGSNVVRKDIGVNHWVQLLKAKLAKRKAGLTILTDVRFPQECALCDLVVELRRPGVEYDERPDSEGGHESRRRLPDHCINLTWGLQPDMNYHAFAEVLLQNLEFKRSTTGAKP